MLGLTRVFISGHQSNSRPNIPFHDRPDVDPAVPAFVALPHNRDPQEIDGVHVQRDGDNVQRHRGVCDAGVGAGPRHGLHAGLPPPLGPLPARHVQPADARALRQCRVSAGRLRLEARRLQVGTHYRGRLVQSGEVSVDPRVVFVVASPLAGADDALGVRADGLGGLRGQSGFGGVSYAVRALGTAVGLVRAVGGYELLMGEIRNVGTSEDAVALHTQLTTRPLKQGRWAESSTISSFTTLKK